MAQLLEVYAHNSGMSGEVLTTARHALKVCVCGGRRVRGGGREWEWEGQGDDVVRARCCTQHDTHSSCVCGGGGGGG